MFVGIDAMDALQCTVDDSNGAVETVSRCDHVGKDTTFCWGRPPDDVGQSVVDAIQYEPKVTL
jgi:hypothetical protein